MKMPLADALTCCSYKPFFEPGFYPQQSDCRVHSLNTGSVCWHQKEKNCPQAQLPLWRLRGREKPGERQLWVDPTVRAGWGEAGRAGGPELRVSRLELERPCEPSAWHFLKAFHFLFCLRSKVLCLSAGERAEASCLPFHRGGFFLAQMEDIPGEAFPRARHGWP